MSTALPATPLFGHEFETQRLVGRVRERGGAVVVRGEVGIGESALLMEASRLAAARGMRTLTTAGVESEAQLPFAGLHQLLRPILAQADGLPTRQRDAVLAAIVAAAEAFHLRVAGPPPTAQQSL